ncbi:MAG: hypothetical protein V1766_06420 [Pseudomonadota bacterium]
MPVEPRIIHFTFRLGVPYSRPGYCIHVSDGCLQAAYGHAVKTRSAELGDVKLIGLGCCPGSRQDSR